MYTWYNAETEQVGQGGILKLSRIKLEIPSHHTGCIYLRFFFFFSTYSYILVYYVYILLISIIFPRCFLLRSFNFMSVQKKKSMSQNIRTVWININTPTILVFWDSVGNIFGGGWWMMLLFPPPSLSHPSGSRTMTLMRFLALVKSRILSTSYRSSTKRGFALDLQQTIIKQRVRRTSESRSNKGTETALDYVKEG